MYLPERQREGAPLLPVHSPNEHHSQGRAQLKPGARNSTQISHVNAGDPGPEPSRSASHVVGGAGSGTLTSTLVWDTGVRLTHCPTMPPFLHFPWSDLSQICLSYFFFKAQAVLIFN